MAWKGSSSSYLSDSNVAVAAAVDEIAAPGAAIVPPRCPASAAAWEMTELASWHVLGPNVGHPCMPRFPLHQSKCSECPEGDLNIAADYVGVAAVAAAAAVHPVDPWIVAPARNRRRLCF